MYTYCCLNNISTVGTRHFTDQYTEVHEQDPSDAILVRSANMKEMEFDPALKAIARAGWTAARRKASSSSTRPAPTATA